MKLSNSLYCRLISIAAVFLIVIAEVFAPVGSDVAPSRILIRFFFFPAGWSVTIFLMIVMSMRDRVILAAAMAAAAAIGALAAIASGGAGEDAVRGCVIAVGFSPYLFTFARIATSSGKERGEWIDLLAVASLIHLSALAIPFFRDQTADWIPRIVDLEIARFDDAFGAQPSALMAQAFSAMPPLMSLSLAAYSLVQIAIIIVAAFHWRRKGADGFSILPAFIIGSMIGFTCYWLAPAIGPKAYFGADFPVLHATQAFLSSQPRFDFDPHHPRNAMPSMHISWAVLVFLYTRGFPIWARCYAGAFVLLTACATLGFGEHYFMDLVVASPLILLVRALCAAGLGRASAERLRAGRASPCLSFG